MELELPSACRLARFVVDVSPVSVARYGRPSEEVVRDALASQRDCEIVSMASTKGFGLESTYGVAWGSGGSTNTGWTTAVLQDRTQRLRRACTESCGGTLNSRPTEFDWWVSHKHLFKLVMPITHRLVFWGEGLSRVGVESRILHRVDGDATAHTLALAWLLA